MGLLLQLVVPVSSSDREGSGWTWWDQAWGQWHPQTSSQNAAGTPWKHPSGLQQECLSGDAMAWSQLFKERMGPPAPR